MRDIMEHVLKLYSYLYGTCNRHSRLTEGRRRLSSYSFDDQNEFQSSRYPNSLWLNSLRSCRQIDGDAFHNGWCRVATYVATQFAAVSMAQQMV